MAVSEHDREYMRRLGESSKKLAAETGWGTPEERAWIFEFVNARRAEIGLPPLEDKDDVPPELGFFERAKALGMLRPRARDPRETRGAVDTGGSARRR